MSRVTSGVLSRDLLPVSIAVFATAALASFQALGIAAALPDIAGALGDVYLLPWVITAFLVTSSLSTVVAGPFIDSVGVSRMFRIAITVFMLAGFASAFAPSMAALVALRVLQGIGAGLVLSTGNTAIALSYPQHLVARAFAANATVWGVMGVAGPAIAAFVLTFLSWQWIFYINLPLGCIALVAGWRVLPGPVGEQRAHFDLRGTALLGIATLATLFAVDALDEVSLAWLAVAGLAVGAYVWHARRRESPVVKLEHIVPLPYRGLALSTALMLTGTFAMNSYIPLYVRAGKEGSSALTAWSILPLTVGWTVGANISSRLADRHSESWIMVLGFLINLPALVVAWSVVAFNWPLALAFGAFFFAGLGVGMTTNAGLTLLQAVTDAQKMGRVQAVHLFSRNQGFTFGAAIGGAVLLFVVTQQLGDVEIVRELLAATGGAAPEGAAEAVRAGFSAAVGVGLVLSIFGWMASVAMRRSLAADRLAKRGT